MNRHYGGVRKAAVRVNREIDLGATAAWRAAGQSEHTLGSTTVVGDAAVVPTFLHFLNRVEAVRDVLLALKNI